jgi:hypothetical protein
VYSHNKARQDKARATRGQSIVKRAKPDKAGRTKPDRTNIVKRAKPDKAGRTKPDRTNIVKRTKPDRIELFKKKIENRAWSCLNNQFKAFYCLK